MITTRRWPRHVVVTTILVILLSACNPPSEDVGAEGVAIVVAHHDTELPPAMSEGERADLFARAASSDHMTAVVIAAGDRAVENVDLEPRRPNGEIERGPRRAVLVEQRLTALDSAIDRAAARSRSVDLLGALGQALRLGAGSVHVLSAGLNSTDPFDMRVSGWDVDPGSLAASLTAAHALPAATGRTVVLSGLGRTAGRQPPLDEAAEQSLRAQWLAVCGATGARCVLDDGARPLRPDVGAALPGPVVPVERVSTRPGPAGVEEISLPSSVLFIAGSCGLRDPVGAGDLLADVADRLRRGTTATVSGRTAPVGPGDGADLAACRAQTVASLLSSSGVPVGALTRVAGDGDRADPPSASRDAGGRPDPTTYPGLRRVVLVVTPPTHP